MELIRKIDHTIFHIINTNISHPILDALMVFVTNQNNWIVPIFILLIWMFLFDGKRGKIAAGILLITILIVDVTAAQIIKPWIGRIRPSHAMSESINLLVRPGGLYSFISNHSANTFALAVVIHYFYGRKLKLMFLFASLVALSRVYVGVHYPADIIGGALYGYGIAWIILSGWVIIKMRELKRNRTWVLYDFGKPN